MTQTSRELVTRALTFDNPERVPRDIWYLPWAFENHPEQMAEFVRDYPNDKVGVPHPCGAPGREKGSSFAVGQYTDGWGCVFNNIHAGIIGEVKEPMVKELEDWKMVQPPWEMIPGAGDISKAIDSVNEFCGNTDKFTSGACCPRPWERYQFLRGTENAMMDVMLREPGVDELLRVIHDYNCKELEFWARTDVDALNIMDDWGSQKQLLIPPEVWRDVFKPMYRDYCDIAKSSGKFIFMHSDGFIEEIYPDLVEIGISALNSQLFCMDMDKLAGIAKGKLAFWGELDRQHVLTSSDPECGRMAVRKAAEKLYSPLGGVFCQFEIGPGCNIATARAACEEWLTF